MPARTFIVTGLVQGVFFRAEAQSVAQELGVSGWVRNARDGSVEIHAEGSQEALRKLEKWCRRGPPQARVKNVQVVDCEECKPSLFEIR